MVNNVYQQKSIAQLMAYLHCCMNAPTVKTYTHAIKMNWLSTFPGLSVEAVQKHLSKSDKTSMGHLHRIRKNI